MSSYFNNIINGVQTVFEGMSITLANLIRKPVTIEYPDTDVSSVEETLKTYQGPLMGMPQNYRGILDVDMEICTACTLCMKACPIDCIIIDNVKCDKTKVTGTDGKQAVKTRTCSRFDIDIGKCMFCGLCVMPCPTGAIFHSNAFELNKDSLDELVLRFVSPEESEQALKRGEEIEKEAAAKKAAKKAKAAEKAKLEKEKEKGAVA